MSFLILFYLVYRVNWLRAKARVDRWVEEQALVKHEMEWTILSFKYQADLWDERSKNKDAGLSMGHDAYSVKQRKLWSAFHMKALEKFGLHIKSSS